MEQARKWLSNPGQDDKGLGQRAIALIVEEGRKVSPFQRVKMHKMLTFFHSSGRRWSTRRTKSRNSPIMR